MVYSSIRGAPADDGRQTQALDTNMLSKHEPLRQGEKHTSENFAKDFPKNTHLLLQSIAS